MWAIWDSVVRHNLKRGAIYTVAAMVCVAIYSFTDSFFTLQDLAKGNLAPTETAVYGGLLILLFIVLNELPIEISSKSHLLILSKPISRNAYVLGKVLGCFTLSFLFLCFFLCVAYGCLVMQCEFDVPLMNNLYKPAFHFSCYLWVISVVSCICGLFLSEAFTIMILGFYIAGSFFIGILPSVLSKAGGGGSLEVLVKTIYFMFPNFQFFIAAEYQDYNSDIAIYMILYCIGISLFLLPITMNKFNKISFS
jgi:hypothetical protein